MTDHAHSPTVLFHAMGLSDKDGQLNNWKMRTAASIKKELGHSEVSFVSVNLWPVLVVDRRLPDN